MTPWSRVELLTRAHSLDGFTCGDGDMDKWFHESACGATDQGTCKVRVFLNDNGEVVAFFGLTGLEIRSISLPKAIGGTGEDEAKDRPYPATLLARLGLHERHRRDGLGPEVVLESFRAATYASGYVASRYIVLDAKNEKLAGWYEGLGFRRSISDPLRLAMKMSKAEKAIRAVEGI